MAKLRKVLQCQADALTAETLRGLYGTAVEELLDAPEDLASTL